MATVGKRFHYRQRFEFVRCQDIRCPVSLRRLPVARYSHRSSSGTRGFCPLCPGATYTHTRRVGWGSSSPVLGELEIDAVKPCSLRPNRKVFFLSKANSIGSNMKRRWKPTLLACRTASRNIGESVASPPVAGYCFCSRQLLMCPHARWISSALVVSSGGSSKAWLLRHP
jgi:hypothetical protein